LKSWAGSDPPRGWIADESLGAPDLSQSPQVACTEWSALRPPEGPARLVAACFETPIASWSAEIEPMALDKIASMALSTALRVRSDATLAPIATQHAEDVTTQSLEGQAARAKTSLGFVQHDGASFAHACFLVCAGKDDACAIVDRATPRGAYVRAPQASFALRAILAAVHHPRATAKGALGLACALGAAAVLTRRRQRTRRADRK